MSATHNTTINRQKKLDPIRPVATTDDTLDLSVVVVIWNSREFIKECLEGIYAAAGERDIEVLIVDNASTDGSAEFITQHYPDVRLTVNERNMGCSVAFNQGLQASKGKYIQILCPDTIVQSNAFDEMIAFLDAHPDTGAVGPRLAYPDGRPQPSCRTFPTFSTFIWEFIGLSRLFPRHPVFGRWRMGDFEHRSVREVDQPRGSSLMVRREMLSDVGLWDEDLEMFFNDVDWCLRMKQHGWKIYFLPDALMIHYGGSSVKKVRPRMILLSHKCCYRFFKKHRKGFGSHLAIRALGLALLVSACVRYVVARGRRFGN